MSDLDATTPQVFLARHGETEWTKNGRFSGITELDLTPKGVKQVKGTAVQVVGPGKLIDPARVVRIWVSPRNRARQTFEHLFDTTGPNSGFQITADWDKVIFTEEIAEWGYGDYEGLRSNEIRAQRKEKGLDKEREWVIWRDGCEGGESQQQVTERLDRLISQIHDIQPESMNGEKPADVVLVAHGLTLRAFARRWLKYSLDTPLPMMISPGAIGVLSYKNHDVDEPGFFLGIALPSHE